MQVPLWVAVTTAQCVVRLLCDLGFKFRCVLSLLCKVFCIRCVVEDEGYGMEDNSQLYGLKIDPSLNPRPALVHLLENIAVAMLLIKPIEFFGNSFFIRSIHSLVIFCQQILNLANNHTVYMGSLRRK